MTAFGKYQLMELIGAGGMAEVYLAKSFGAEGLEKLLVIKRIRREFATRPRFVSMFIDEAKIAVSLNHPNVVQVYEFGRVGEDYFLAMEYVEGTDLGKLMHAVSSHGAMVDPADAMYIAIETAKGLDYAHRKKDQYGQPLGIVHRDISPQNILISKDGGVKLVDFGIAKATVASDDSLGEVKGKLSYMSPEQARGLAVDQRSDVFSLGIVLWEILAGRTLFPFSSHAATLKLVKNSVVPPLAEMREDLPADLVAIVDSMLAKEAADRPASARDVQVALTKCLFASGTVADSVTLVELMDEYGENLMLSQELAIEATRFGIEGTLPPGMVDTTGVGATNPNSAHPTAVFQVTPFTDDFAVENVLGADLTDATGETDRAIDEQQRFYSGEIDAFRGPEERTERTENVLVCGDLRGFSALRERTTSERWRQVLLDYIRIVEAIAFKNSAVVDRVGEDGFTLILGLPVSSENDAERAMSLAQDVLEAVDAMGINLESQLQLSMGVVVGSVVVEYQHSDGLDGPQFDWSWDEESAGQGGLQIAEALARSAMPREVLMGGRIFRRVRRRFEAQAVDPVLIELDGKQFSLATHRLVGPLSGRQQLTQVRHSYQQMVGRELELRALRDRYRDVLLKNRTRAVWLRGEQGVGKSTLVGEFAAGIESQDAEQEQRVNIVRSVTDLGNKDTPYGTLVTITREMLQLGHQPDLRKAWSRLQKLETTTLSQLPDGERRFVVHTIGFLLGVKIPGNVIERLDPENRRARIYSSMRLYLEAEAAHCPMVFALEDIHNADRTSVEFLGELLSEGLDAPILFVITSLPIDVETSAAEAHWQRFAQAAHVTTEQLGELDGTAAKKLALASLPEELATHEQIVDAIIQRAGGNPLYIKEVIELIGDRNLTDPVEVRALLSTGDDEQLLIPTTVEGLVTSRIDKLPAGPKQTLQRVGLLGLTFGESLLSAIFPEPGHEGRTGEQSLATADRHLKLLVDRGFLARLDKRETKMELDLGDLADSVDGLVATPSTDSGATERRWAFTNSVIQRVSERGVVEPERGQLHAQIADHLLARSDDAFKVDMADVAWHLDAAGEAERAGEMYLVAAEQALETVGGNESLRLVDRALARIEPDSDRYRTGLELKERALALVGEPERRQQTLEQLLDLMEAQGASVRRRLQTRLRMTRLLYDRGDLQQAEEIGETILADARQHADANITGSALRQLVMIYRDTGRRERALEAVEEARQCFESAGDVEGLWAALVSRGITLRQGGQTEEALATYKRAFAIIENQPFSRQHQTTLINMGLLYVSLGELDKALANYNQALVSIRALGHVRDEAALLANLGHLFLLIGDLSQAHQVLVRSIKLARRTDDKLAMADGVITLGLVQMARNREREAELMLKRGLRQAREISNVYLASHAILGLAELRLSEGRDNATREALSLADEAMRRGQDSALVWAQAHGASLGGLSHLALGDPETGLQLSAQAMDLLEEANVDGAELILIRHAAILDAVGDEGGAAARQRARSLVFSRRDRILDPTIRQGYMSSRHVREVLDAVEGR